MHSTSRLMKLLLRSEMHSSMLILSIVDENKSQIVSETQNNTRWGKSEEQQTNDMDTQTEKKFSETTTIHGIRFLTETERPLYEKVFWYVIMVFVCYWMVQTITNQIRNYLNNPVLMNIDGESIEITDIPFPALTFCSDNQVHPSFVNISDLLNKPNKTDDEHSKLEIGLSLCHDEKIKSKLLDTQKNNSIPDLSKRLRMHGAENCARIVRHLLWEQKDIPLPCKYFQVTITTLGICYTFNMLPASQLYTEDYFKDLSLSDGLLLQDYQYFQSEKVWDLESGFKDKGDNGNNAVLPWRLSSMRFQLMPVSFLIDFNADDMDERCVTGHTFTVALHNPAEPPTGYSTITQAVTDRGNYIRIVPKIVTTSTELQGWSPKDRGCFFNDERKLKYFKIYTIRNCEIECETNITIRECNCSLLSQPHFSSSNTCKADKMQCYKESLVQTLDSSSNENDCNCLPSCDELTYDIEYFNLPDKFTEYNEVHKIHERRNISRNLAIFYALFKTTRIKSVQRVAVVITSDIIANIGGLMGLFLGVSVISLFEIVYFSMNWMIRIFN